MSPGFRNIPTQRQDTGDMGGSQDTSPRDFEALEISRNLPEIGRHGFLKIFVQIWPEASDYIFVFIL